jgi:hypothetical protein
MSHNILKRTPFANLYAELLEVALRGDKTFYSDIE